MAAKMIGGLDIGQAAVCCEGLVLALEAQEGTDAMLRRVATLAPAIRGAPGQPRGVLAKACKPVQERRIDLPTIGLATIQRAAEAGLAGIAGEAGLVLVIDRDAVVELADRLGLFVVGVPATLMVKPCVMIVAAEPSGDILGAGLLAALRQRLGPWRPLCRGGRASDGRRRRA